ncbi:hypothetical protein V5O48_009693 [Marasmius crinis-equi]|uniref:Uncharacterized protein n=1 Tax=Marasmius crinis-equi TaxID=585013 RepID=A0ABR3FAK9_9AGAR
MRKTRSGARFSPYEINPDVDFHQLIAQAFSHQSTDPAFDGFSDASPLSTPPLSRGSSRSSSPLPATTRSEPLGASSQPEPAQAQPRTAADEAEPVPKSKPNHKKRQSKKNRGKKRKLEKITGGCDANQPAPALKKKHVASAQPEPTNLRFEDIRVAGNGFTGYHGRRSAPKKEYTLDEMVGPASRFKFRLIGWDGTYTMPVISPERRVVAVCLSNPDDPDWIPMTTRVADKGEAARKQGKFNDKQKGGPRGRFSFFRAGVTFGMGMKKPARQKQSSKANEEVVEELLRDPDVQRLAGFPSSAFSVWSPDLFGIYSKNRAELLDNDPSLRFNFSNSVFAAVSFNLGPRTVTVEHADTSNRCDGFCAVTALSPTEDGYDYTTGGHLILWDLGLVIEFPPGSTILLPSAVFRHSNVAIGKKERRLSFTQYTSGGLFRWVERGFQTQTDYFAGLSDDEREEEEVKDAMRWKEALQNFTKLDDIL